MADFYISPSGSNGNSGTQASPWLDLSYAIMNSSSGDTIYCASGSYPTDTGSESDLTLLSPRSILGPNVGIPYDGVRGAEAEIDTSNEITISSGSVVIDGLEFVGSPSPSPVRLLNTSSVGDIDNVFVSNNIFSGASPNGISVFRSGGSEVRSITDVTIDGNLIDGPTASGMFIDPFGGTAPSFNFDGFLIENNKVANMSTDWGILLDGVNNFTVRNNIIDSCKRSLGIKGGRIASSPTGLVEGNTVTAGSDTNHLYSFGHPDDTSQLDANCVCQGNTFLYDTDVATALFYGGVIGNCKGLTFKNNTVRASGSTLTTDTTLLVEALSSGGNLIISDNTFDGGTVSALTGGIVLLTSSSGIPAGSSILAERNFYSGFGSGVATFPSKIDEGASVIVRGSDFTGLPTGINNAGTGTGIIDGRFNCWGGTGASGGAVDPDTGAVADGDGAEVSTFVLFDPQTCGYEGPFEESTFRSLSTNGDLTGGGPSGTVPTRNTPATESSQGDIEEAQYEGAINIHGTDGEQKFITKGGGSGNWETTLNAEGGGNNLTRRNSGVVTNYNDNAGRFDNPGKA
jgi:hypothetical protein